jgi:hypothetical protein
MRIRTGKAELLPEATTLLNRLVTSVPDQQFTDASYYITKTWEHLISNPHPPQGFQALSPLILSRLAGIGNIDAVELLMKDAKADPKKAVIIDPLLLQAAAAPLPASGYADSRLSMLTIAGLRVGDLARAQSMLSNANWPASATDASKQDATLLGQTLAAVIAVNGGKADSLPNAMTLYGQLAARIGTSDKQTCTDIQKALAAGATQAINASLQAGSSDKTVLPILTSMPVSPDSEMLWDKILRAWLLAHVEASDSTIQQLGPLVAAYGPKFSKPDYETQFWQNAWSTVKPPLGDQVHYLNKAFSVASTDPLRTKALTTLMRNAIAKGEFDLALQVAQGAAGLISDATCLAQIKEQTDDATKGMADAQTAVASRDQQMQKERLQNQLTITQDNLKQAQAQGHTADVQRLQATVDILNQQLGQH